MEEQSQELRNGIFCAVCKTPYSGLEELRYCDDHRVLTAHPECSDRCVAVGCGKQLTQFAHLKSGEELSAGVRKSIGNTANEDAQSRYAQYVDELGRRAKAALRAVYQHQRNLEGRYSIVKGIDELQRLYIRVNSEGISISLDKKNIIVEGHALGLIIAKPEHRTILHPRKFLWPKKELVKTGELKMSFRYVLCDDERSYDSVIEGIKRKPVQSGYFDDIRTLEAICLLPRTIKKTHAENTKKQLSVLEEALKDE